MSSNTRQKLLQAAQRFCNAFADQKPLEEILGHFSSSKKVRAFEHGLPDLAPFLGREFVGRDGIRKYFETISGLLTYENMKFGKFIVDPETHEVFCKGEARFTWASTGQGWDETFAYMLHFDDEFKVKDYEIWADTGAAYLASKGQLES